MGGISTLRDEIQAELLDSDVCLSGILRKASVLAYKLKNNQLKEWLDNELNGYSDSDALPEYRVLHTLSFGSFMSGAWQVSNQPILTAHIDNLHDFATRQRISDSIAKLESAIRRNDETLRIAWMPEAIALLNAKLENEANCMTAYKTIDKGQLVEILETTRNKLLQLVLEIGEVFNETENPGDVAEIHEIPIQRIDTIVNNVIVNQYAEQAIAQLGDNSTTVATSHRGIDATALETITTKILDAVSSGRTELQASSIIELTQAIAELKAEASNPAPLKEKLEALLSGIGDVCLITTALAPYLQELKTILGPLIS